MWEYKKVLVLVLMCSITNTAHARSPPATRTEEARGAGQRSRMDCDVYLLSCLYVIIDYPAALSAVSRVVSVCRFAHPHSLEILDNSAGEKKPHQATRFFS